MRAMIAVGLATIVLSCSGCGPSFADEGEELAYLSALSNPSPGQWKRRGELGEKRDAKRIADQEWSDRAWKAESDRADREAAARKPAEDKKRAEEEKAEVAGKLADLQARAVADDADGHPKSASMVYQDMLNILDKYPGLASYDEFRAKRDDADRRDRESETEKIKAEFELLKDRAAEHEIEGRHKAAASCYADILQFLKRSPSLADRAIVRAKMEQENRRAEGKPD